MKEKVLKWLEGRLFTWSTAVGIILILFVTLYRKELSSLVGWFFLYPARQLITNVVNNSEFTSDIIEGIAIVVGGLFLKHKSRKNKEE